MKVALIGTYLPRKCGIATFTSNLYENIRSKENTCAVIAINDGEDHDYPPEVIYQIGQDNIADYISASEFLNKKVDVVYLQHEFGIYGGQDGGYVIQLMKSLEMPVITTLHTIIDEPSAGQAKILTEIARYSAQIIVMSETGKKMLCEIYDIEPGKIEIIGHGIPDPTQFQPKNYREELGIGDKKVLLTFGLLSKTKGIEIVIKALPEVIQKHPDTVYIVLGATHPHVVKYEGESYRDSLKELIHQLNLEEHVIFIDRFVSQEELFGFLKLSDIYIIPYLSKKQITSGTLVYAMATNNAVVSTPFWHAEEALSDNRGIFFKFYDSNALAGIVNVLLHDEDLLKSYREKAMQYANQYDWKNIGNQYVLLFNKISLSRLKRIGKTKENEKISRA